LGRESVFFLLLILLFLLTGTRQYKKPLTPTLSPSDGERENCRELAQILSD